MKLVIVLSTHAAQFEAVALKGDLATNVARIADRGYADVEPATRDPGLVDCRERGLFGVQRGLNQSLPRWI